MTSGQLSFPAMEADFGPGLSAQGYTGMLAVASPIHACDTLKPSTENVTQFLLIERGGDPPCNFDDKVCFY